MPVHTDNLKSYSLSDTSFICDHRHLICSSFSFFFLSEGTNFRNVLDKAVGADQVVRDRYNTQCDMIALLCKPENELNAAIPSANPTKTLQGSEVRCVPA